MAAGHGKRMQTDTPKALLRVADRPMLLWVLDALAGAGVNQPVVVIGRDGEQVRAAVAADGHDVVFATQAHPAGTADAVAVGLAALCQSVDFDGDTAGDADDVVVLAADAPLIAGSSIAELIKVRRAAHVAATLLTAQLDDPTGYGRVIRHTATEAVARIVEHADATAAQLRITQVNASAYCFDRAKLAGALDAVTESAASGELYLTAAIAHLADADQAVLAVPTHDPNEVLGANTPAELAVCEAILLRRSERG